MDCERGFDQLFAAEPNPVRQFAILVVQFQSS